MWNLEREIRGYKHSKRFLFQISSLCYWCTQSLWITFTLVFYSEISRCCLGGQAGVNVTSHGLSAVWQDNRFPMRVGGSQAEQTYKLLQRKTKGQFGQRLHRRMGAQLIVDGGGTTASLSFSVCDFNLTFQVDLIFRAVHQH